MLQKKPQKTEPKFFCNFCAFGTCNKKDFNRHLLTAKHIKNENIDNFTPKNPKSYRCECGKLYSYRQSLNLHHKKCVLSSNLENDMIKKDKDNVDYKNLILELVNKNNELQNTIKEIVPKIGNTNTINQKFNVNVFLNEKCKDAINISDFVKSIEVSLEQLDITKNKGLEYGLCNVILENMNRLSIYERPVHCTDTKRETLYVKEDNIWEKDSNKTKIIKAIKQTSNKKYEALRCWTLENPDFKNDEIKQEYFAKTISNIGKNLECINDKVIKKICSNTKLKESFN